MHTRTPIKPVKAMPRPLSAKPSPRKAMPSWKPQVPNLTRDEIREIVIDLIG
ncbi:hypothetical protein [Microvirga pudoricolor]|uniref:hypothetical protein n=1 Tax=Microvirga pudoricolor TaxID=2778729 RepID=UPI00194F32CD|nr:hypothetical protein [Microvirga pudoricolor]MBM6595180.1 hypothetical protein [Microvirga pudoricolor]